MHFWYNVGRYSIDMISGIIERSVEGMRQLLELNSLFL